ncbi:hypothetical protein HMPREF0541_02814 [Lacticaseibacillus rhamnosus ATCC 21052]|nr:hypothetical protein HMPREF0541_02814 [Lacticaseibacillus rhamnosus ATCC 21052]
MGCHGFNQISVSNQSCCDFSQRKKSSRVNDNDSAAFDFWKRLLTLP